MKRSFAASVLFASAGVLMLMPSARGDDFAPPTYRGQPLSVRAEWEFTQPPTSFFDIYADLFSSVSGPTQYPLFSGFPAKAEADLSSNWMWVPGDGDGGLTPAPGVPSASLGFKIPNFVDDLSEKLLRVQITYQVPIPIAPPDISQVQGWFGFGGTVGPVLGVPDGPVFIVSTIHVYQDWRITPNPSWELISISVPQGMVLDEVIVDTISIPTPGTFGMLALTGGWGAWAGRRRRASAIKP